VQQELQRGKPFGLRQARIGEFAAKLIDLIDDANMRRAR
jgi:hypothetical protein